MALDEWDTLPSGNLSMTPVAGWSTAALSNGLAGALRVEFSLENSLKGAGSVQLFLTAKQVRMLGEALSELADVLEQ